MFTKCSRKINTRSVNQKENKELYFLKSKAGKEMARQRGNIGQWGNLMDTRNAPLEHFVYEIEHLAKAAKLVCQIRITNGRETTTGTGFRVGSKYIMTAFHVVKPLLDTGKSTHYFLSLV